MIHIKSEKEIEIMKHGGHILADVLFEVVKHAKPGVTELELDKMAEELIVKKGGEPGFKKVEGYKHTICISTNDNVVHGIPTKYALKEGDVVGIDCGVFYEGFHTDMAETVLVGNPHTQEGDLARKFLEVGKHALEEAIKQAKPGNRIGEISKTIQTIVEKQNGYSIVRSLVGHGVGKELHEEPEVPGFLYGKIEKTPKLLENMTIAVEIIYNMGSNEVVYANTDGWTIKTRDGSISGVFERSIYISKHGPVLLTQ